MGSDPFSFDRDESAKPKEDWLGSTFASGKSGSGAQGGPSDTDKAIGWGLGVVVIALVVAALFFPAAAALFGGYVLYWAWQKPEHQRLRSVFVLVWLFLFFSAAQWPVIFLLRSAVAEFKLSVVSKGFDRVLWAMYNGGNDVVALGLIAFSILAAFWIGHVHRERQSRWWAQAFLSSRYYEGARRLVLFATAPFSKVVLWGRSIHAGVTLLALVGVALGVKFGYDFIVPRMGMLLPQTTWPFFGILRWPVFMVMAYRIVRDLRAYVDEPVEDPQAKNTFSPPEEKAVPWVTVGKDRMGADIGFSLSELEHHMHVVGQSGSGKSVFLRNLYAHHIREGLGFAFIDLKADEDELGRLLTLAKEHQRLSDVWVLDVARPNRSLSYNLLDRGNATELKDKLLGSFDWSEIHYKKVAERVLLTLCQGLVAVRDETKQVVTLLDLHRCLMRPEAIRILSSEVPKAHTGIRSDLNDLAEELSTRANQERIEGLRTDLYVLVKSEFGRLLTEPAGGLDFVEAIEKGKIVYVLLNSQQFGGSSQRLGKMILSDLKVASGRMMANEAVASHFGVIVDEFSELATEDFIGFLNKARGSKMAVTIAHQELSDLQRFSPTLRDQIFGCTQTTVAFLQKNPLSAELLAGVAGTKAGKEITKQTTNNILFRGYTGMGSEKIVEEFRMHPNEFKSLNVGEAIVIAKNPPRTVKINVEYLDLPEAPISEKVWAAINQVERKPHRPALNIAEKEEFLRTQKKTKGEKVTEEESKPALSDWKVKE